MVKTNRIPSVIPYKDQSSKEAENDVAGTMASTLPMVAVSGLCILASLRLFVRQLTFADVYTE